jgi:hypothetical protein
MTFLNFGALFGLAAVGIPIVIHLLSKMRVKEMAWAAQRFLRDSIQKNKRRLEIEDLLLLLLRCLLIALLILALSRPAWRSAVQSASSHQVTAVIIIDNSASMGLSNGIRTSFERAQSAAEQILLAFPSGSSSALYFASNIVQPVIAQPTFDFDLLRQTIHRAQLTDRSTDLGEALQLAVSSLQKQGASNAKEIYLITDGQANGWGNLEQMRSELGEIQKQIAVHIVLVGGESETNLAVTGLRLEGGLAPIDQPLRCSIEVTNESEAEAHDVRVSLLVDDQPAADETVIDRIAPGTSRGVALFAKLRSEGYHTITARIPPDRLPADDQRTLAVKTVREVKVLLVQGTTAATPSLADDFFVRNALVPVPASDAGQFYIKTTTVSASQLDTTALADYDAVFLLDVEEIGQSEAAALAGYVHQGGGLVLFPGPDCRIDSYNRNLAADGFLPATLGPEKGNPNQRATFFTLQSSGYDHPIVTLWNDPAAGTLSGAHFYAYYPLTPTAGKPPAKGEVNPPGGKPRVILHFAQNNDPFAVEHTWGSGRVILFASTATTSWNDLPVTQAFVPLIQRVLGSLVERQTEGLNIEVGQKFASTVSHDLLHQDVNIRLPGEPGPGRVVGQAILSNGLPSVQFADTDRAGAYHVSIGPAPGTTLEFAAQADPNESNLTPLSAAQVKSLGSVAEVTNWSPEARNSLTPKLTSGRAGHELWVQLLIAALIIAVAETFLAQWFTQAK